MLLFVVFCIEPIVTKHFKMFFRDMYDQSLDKIKSRDTFRNGFIVFVPSVMEGYKIPIVIIDTGSGNHRAAQISADIFNSNVRGTEIGFGSDVKTIWIFFIKLIFEFLERVRKPQGKLFQKDFTKGEAKEIIIEMFYGLPGKIVAGGAFGNKGVDMRVPFEITAEGVENTDEAGSKVFSFIHFGKHAKDDIPDRVE